MFSSDSLVLPKNIFLLGKMGAGKDFVGKALIEKLGYERLSFAYALKKTVADKYGITLEELDANKADYREELQSLGNSMRQSDLDYWVKRWKSQREAIAAPVVCTDCRHFNEGMFGVSDRDSLVVKVTTDPGVRESRLKVLYGDVPAERHLHPSEVEVDMAPYNIELCGVLATSEVVSGLKLLYLNWLHTGQKIHFPSYITRDKIGL